MIPFRKILIPTDYSPACEVILPYVKEMAGRFSCELSLVHAYEDKSLGGAYRALVDPTELRVFENHRLRAYASKIWPIQHIECFASPGEPGTVIDRIIAQQGIDLVMLPTHGRGPIRRLLVGSVATKILHDASAAVWTATCPLAQSSLPYRSILCALDETAEAEAVLRAATWLAEEYEAALSIIHVITLPPASIEMDYATYEREMLASQNARMLDLKTRVGVKAPHRVAGGPVAGTIREEAVRQNSDLIVIGRGLAQGGLERIWSSLYEIVREAPCAVLSI